MTILTDLLKSGDYKIPAKFFEANSGFDLEYESDDHRLTGTIFIRDRRGEAVMEMHLPEHYLEQMLHEYVFASVNSLRKDARDLMVLHKQLTEIPKEHYTRGNGEDNDIDGSELDGTVPAVQPRRVVEQILEQRPGLAAAVQEARRRVRGQPPERPNRWRNDVAGATTNQTGAIPTYRAPTPPEPATLDERPPEQPTRADQQGQAVNRQLTNRQQQRELDRILGRRPRD